MELAKPATQLALVIEAAPEDGLPARIIPELAYRPLAEMLKLPLVAKHLEPLLERHRGSIDILRRRAEARDKVIFFDVSDLDLEGYNKFIPYLLHPQCVYSVSVSSSAVRAPPARPPGRPSRLSFVSPAYLLFLLLVPVLIALYFKKSRPMRKVVPSLPPEDS